MSEWKEKYLKQLVEIRVSNVDKKIYPDKTLVKLCNYMDVYGNAYISQRISFTTGSADSNEVQRFGLKVDDVIITKDSETPDDIAVPSVVIEELQNVVCGYHLAILRPNKAEIDGTFLMLKLRDNDLKNYFSSVANGSTRYGLTIGNIENARIKYPSLATQHYIAKVITTIDSVLAKTQSTIAKYKGIKQGMLHDLFTRGIDIQTGKLRPAYKDAPQLYKESKLGMVPRAWDNIEFIELIKSVDSGWSPNCLAEPASIGEWGSLKTTSVTWDGYNPKENKKLPNNILPLEDTEVDFDDILITRVGPRARVGVAVHVNDHRKKLMVSDNMLRFKLIKSEKLFLPFLALFLGSHHVQSEWQKRIAGLAEAQVVINQQIINKTVILLPKSQEQKMIFERLNAITGKIVREQNYLNKLQHLKAGLMSDLLNGKKKIKLSVAID